MLAPRCAGLARLAATLVSGILAAGCCVAPPAGADLFAIGFRSPEQAFSTFQTAVRADDPALLRRCFSAGFVAQNGLSEQVFREYWDELRKEEPLLRKGVADARLEEPVEVRRDRARLRAETHGRHLIVELVREDYCEAWGGAEKLADEAAPFGERTGLQEGEGGGRWIYGRMPLPAGVEAGRITELRVGREWKIDAFDWSQGKQEKRADAVP